MSSSSSSSEENMDKEDTHTSDVDLETIDETEVSNQVTDDTNNVDTVDNVEKIKTSSTAAAASATPLSASASSDTSASASTTKNSVRASNNDTVTSDVAIKVACRSNKRIIHQKAQEERQNRRRRQGSSNSPVRQPKAAERSTSALAEKVACRSSERQSTRTQLVPTQSTAREKRAIRENREEQEDDTAPLPGSPKSFENATRPGAVSMIGMAKQSSSSKPFSITDQDSTRDTTATIVDIPIEATLAEDNKDIERLEAEKEVLRLRLEQQENQAMMGTILKAEIVSDPPSSSNNSQGDDDRNGRRYILCYVCCPLILVAIILGIVLPLTKKEEEAPQSEYDFLVDLLEPISGDSIFVDESPQYQAFDWLLNDDPAILDIKSTKESNLIHRYALATFYYATDGPNWNDHFNFLSKESICDWSIQNQGVTCSESGEPVELGFNGIDINGAIPAEISALSTLTRISFANDRGLVGTVPTEIGLMTSLTFLQFFQTGMGGTIPESLSALVNLQTLALAINSFSGTIPDIFSDPSSSWSILSLQRNNFEGTLPPLRPQSELTWLIVSDNARLTGSLPESLYSQPELEWVSFRDTGIGGRISPKISALTSLEIFQAGNAQFSGFVPTAIGNLGLLKELSLGNNTLTGALPSQLGQLNRLKVLNLDGNDLSGTIPNELAGMKNIEILQLNGNSQLRGSVPATFAEEFGNLLEFNIEGTNITSGLAESFCQLDVLNAFVSADCGGEDPAIPCDCCVECCVDGEDCVLSMTTACDIRSYTFANEERGAACACEPGGSSYTCQETCHICSADGSTCAQSTGYGFELDQLTGDNRYFTNTYEYTLGGWDHVIEFRNDVISAGADCEVYVNGALCDTCTGSTCENGFNGFSVDCSNLEPGLTFRSCFPDFSEPNALDVFRYFDAGFANDTVCQPIFST